MELVTLKAISSQRFNITLSGNNYDIRIFSTEGSMACDISINGVSIISGFKMINDVPLLVYPSQEVSGNLVLSLPDDETPNYEGFGLSQFLYHLNAAETIVYRKAFEL